MTEELVEGLYLAAVGMGLVFLTLVAFMLILFALQKLFPGEEVVDDTSADKASVEVRVTDGAQQASAQPSSSIAQEPSVTVIAPSGDSMIGEKIAAMTAATYLAMEQEDNSVGTSVVAATPRPSQGASDWVSQSRALGWQSQGQRPQPYGQKSHSAYPPREGSR
ncbi:MAG: OadG family protein [Dehalococcoidia bacterium]|jgi:Na+-transporting methylmalonyl-CoA/oxaloacetate decarboxylase gamma subunit|nr:OadG family protein [Dehalococcoidia bacterium]